MITTHDDIWYEDILERCNNFISYEIIRWNESEGVVINSYKDIWEKIKFYISQSDMIASGHGSRQYTEWIFNEIGEMTGSRVPLRRNNKYTLEETLTSVSSRLNELLEPSLYKNKINILLKDIKETKYISNLTSHDNKLEIALLSIKDIEEFSNYVHQLHQAFICPDCGKILKYYNDRKRICCKNSDCRSKFEIYCK
jgi:hypothetical protein